MARSSITPIEIRESPSSRYSTHSELKMGRPSRVWTRELAGWCMWSSLRRRLAERYRTRWTGGQQRVHCGNTGARTSCHLLVRCATPAGCDRRHKLVLDKHAVRLRDAQDATYFCQN